MLPCKDRVIHPGFSGGAGTVDSNWLVGFRSAKLGEDGGRLHTRSGGIVERAMELDGVERGDPDERGELNAVDRSLRSLPSDELGLIETVDGLSQRVVVGIAAGPDGWDSTDLGDAFAVAQ